MTNEMKKILRLKILQNKLNLLLDVASFSANATTCHTFHL